MSRPVFSTTDPGARASTLVVASSQEAAEDFEHELSLYCPERPVVYLPPRGVWYGSEGEVKPRVVGPAGSRGGVA